MSQEHFSRTYHEYIITQHIEQFVSKKITQQPAQMFTHILLFLSSKTPNVYVSARDSLQSGLNYTFHFFLHARVAHKNFVLDSFSFE